MKHILHILILFILSISLLANQPVSAAPVTGAQLYLGHCAKCHGREGEGFLKLYPPIRNSSYLKDNVSKLPCIIRFGLKGEIVVDGVTFNQIMPAIQQIKPNEIEQIIVFLQGNWDHPSTPLDVPEWLKECEE